MKTTAIIFSLGFASLVACSANVTPGPGGNGGGGGDDSGAGGNQDSAVAAGGDATIVFPKTCPSYTACGGSLEGTWDYSAGCVEDPFHDLDQACPGITVSDLMGHATGYLSFTPTTVTRHATVHTSATLVVPGSCAEAAGGCAAIEKSILQGGYSTASCTGTSDCSCAVTRETTLNDASAYVVSGGTVTVGSGTYDFCASGGNLSYKAHDQNAEPGQYQLKAR